MATETHNLPHTQLVTAATSGSPAFHAVTPWSAIDPENDTGRLFAAEIQDVTGTGMSVEPVVQITNSVTDLSSAAITALTSAAFTTNGIKDAQGNTAVSVAGYRFKRFGFRVWVTSGTGSVVAAAALQMFPG